MEVMKLIEKIHNAVKEKKSSIGKFSDLSKAFDTINILLYKMDYYMGSQK